MINYLIKTTRILSLLLGLFMITVAIIIVFFPGDNEVPNDILVRISGTIHIFICGILLVFPYRYLKKGFIYWTFLILLILLTIGIIATIISLLPYTLKSLLEILGYVFASMILLLNIWAFFMITKRNSNNVKPL